MSRPSTVTTDFQTIYSVSVFVSHGPQSWKSALHYTKTGCVFCVFVIFLSRVKVCNRFQIKTCIPGVLITIFNPFPLSLKKDDVDMMVPTQPWQCMRWCPVTPWPGRCQVQDRVPLIPAQNCTSRGIKGPSRSSKCASAPTTTWEGTSSWLNVTVPGRLGWEHP